MDSFKNETIENYTKLLSTASPVPGGGGTAALAASLGAALGRMVASLTIGKKKYAEYEAELKSCAEKSDALIEQFLSLIDRDAEVFEPLSRAYSLPKETEEERAKKAEVMEKCLRDAASAPFEILSLCRESVGCVRIFAEKGSVLAISDAGCASALIGAAARSAALNVSINTKLMQDRVYAENMNAQTETLLHETVQEADDIYRSVSERLKVKK